VSVTTFFEKMIGLQQQRSEEKQSSYRGLVADIAVGKEPSPAEVECLLAETHKSITELKRDVEAYQHRMVLKASVAALPSLEQEFAQVQQKIAEADRSLEEAERTHYGITAPLYGRLEVINEARNEATKAKQELFDTCDDEQLKCQLEKTNDELNRLLESNKDLSTHAILLDNKADSERRRADRELTEADRDYRREQASLFRKQAESLRQRIKAIEKAQVDAVKQRDRIEDRMRQS